MIERLNFLKNMKPLSNQEVLGNDLSVEKEPNIFFYWLDKKISKIEENNPNIQIKNDKFIMGNLYGGDTK